MPRISRPFSLFVALSLLIHLGVFYYFTTREHESGRSDPNPAPFVVDLREAKLKPRELDIPLRQQISPRTQPARRLAADDLIATREEAPHGQDRRETTTMPLPPTVSPTPAPPQELPVHPVDTTGSLPVLSKESLMLAAKNAAQNVAGLDPEINRKMRQDVAEGRAVWIDTEKDILGSFYKRFRNAVEDVWDYPKDAISRGEAGVCLYRIEINRAGVLINEPQLLKSSGSPRLDEEAARAVRAASPRFGFLPDSYRYETLSIFAYFDYRLGSRSIYGEPYYR